MAVYDAHANLAVSSVATAPSPATSGTSLVVASGEGSRFPAVPFNATLWPSTSTPTPANAEIVRVTAISTDTFTITRAQESTTAKTVTTSFLIAATVTAKTVTDLETNTEYAFSAWKHIAAERADSVPAARASGTYILFEQGGIALNAAGSAFGAFYLDPADYGAGSRTIKVRIRLTWQVGGVGPGTTITVNLAPVSTWTTAGSNVRAGIATVGTTVVTANTASPAANTQGHSESSTATLASAGWYVLSEVLSGNVAANSQTEIRVQLQCQQV